jgi:hypothetical protein
MVRLLTRFGGYLVVFFGTMWLVLPLLFQPSHDRDWAFDHRELPKISIRGDEVVVERFRDFEWVSELSASERYETRIFRLRNLEGVDVVVSRFGSFDGLAHILFSFDFGDGKDRVVISLEARREADETYSPLLGMVRQYETIYVVGSEKDVVGLREEKRKERVSRHRTTLSPEESRQFFVKIAEDVNAVYRAPKFYNTLTDNCLNALTRRWEEVTGTDFPEWSWNMIFPGYFDEVLREKHVVSFVLTSE